MVVDINWKNTCLAVTLAFFCAGCSPTVKVEAPDKPIEINLNIKIEQEVRVKIDKDIEDIFADDPDLFGISEEQ